MNMILDGKGGFAAVIQGLEMGSGEALALAQPEGTLLFQVHEAGGSCLNWR